MATPHARKRDLWVLHRLAQELVSMEDMGLMQAVAAPVAPILRPACILKPEEWIEPQLIRYEPALRARHGPPPPS